MENNSIDPFIYITITHWLNATYTGSYNDFTFSMEQPYASAVKIVLPTYLEET